MSLVDDNLPISLYFDLLCQRMNVPEEMSVLILALVERYYRSKAHYELQEYYDLMNPQAGQVALETKSR